MFFGSGWETLLPNLPSFASALRFVRRQQVFSGRGLGRRLFQKGGLPSVTPGVKESDP